MKFIIMFLGVCLNMNSLANSNLQNNTMQNDDLSIRYYLGMNFPKYNHPAKLYDEIDKNTVLSIKKVMT